MCIFKTYKFSQEKEFFIFKQLIARYGKKQNSKETIKYFSLFPGKSLEHLFFDKILKNIEKKHDTYFILRANGLGEIYMFLLAIEELCKKYKSKKPCIIAFRESHKSLCEHFSSNIPCYLIDIERKEVNNLIVNKVSRYKRKTFVTIHSTLQQSLEIFNNYLPNSDDNYPNVIKNLLGVKEYSKNLKTEKINKKDFKQKLQNINTNKLVYIIPEANSLKHLTSSFWYTICSKLEEKGYEVFVNSLDGKSNYGKSADLTIPEVMHLATLAKGIVALRNGFVEIMSSNRTPKHIIYTPHKYNPVSASEMMRNSSLNHYPMVDKNTVFEYNTDELSETQIIDEIMKGF